MKSGYKTLEICIEGLEDGINAVKAGADRLEINSALALGGLTPSTGLLKTLRAKVNVPLIVMIRPRHGYFHYSKQEFYHMQQDAEDLLSAGADGIAFGFLNQSGEIDREKVRMMVKIAQGYQTVFHRAFDLLADHSSSMHLLSELGITRILTSGGKVSAIEGRDCIKELIRQSKGRIEILPAGGIRPENARAFIHYTGASQLHSSCQQRVTINNQSAAKINFIDSDLNDRILLKVDVDKVQNLSELKLDI